MTWSLRGLRYAACGTNQGQAVAAHRRLEASPIELIGRNHTGLIRARDLTRVEDERRPDHRRRQERLEDIQLVELVELTEAGSHERPAAPFHVVRDAESWGEAVRRQRRQS